jgi:phosphoserine phosphatase RsbU/P
VACTGADLDDPGVVDEDVGSAVALERVSMSSCRRASGRKVVAELSCEPALPFGLGDSPPDPSTDELQPDDAVLFYTDGVVEARTPDGELFGLNRLADLLEREAASGQPAEEMLRRLVRAVLNHQAGGLRDDATLMLVQWTGPAGR